MSEPVNAKFHTYVLPGYNASKETPVRADVYGELAHIPKIGEGLIRVYNFFSKREGEELADRCDSVGVFLQEEKGVFRARVRAVVYDTKASTKTKPVYHNVDLEPTSSVVAKLVEEFNTHIGTPS